MAVYYVYIFYICCLGTKETLWNLPNSKNISVRDQLLEFHSKWYSSHLMYLTILGKGIK
jgi:insulysin